jgi:hypothetical protein
MNWAKLRQQVASSLNIEELRSLCFDLGIDYDDLSGEGKNGNVRELIALMRRNDEIPRLIEHLSEIRPNIPWADTTYLDESYKEAIKNTDMDEEDEGILDHALTIVEAGNRLVVLMERAGEAAELLSYKMEANTIQLQLTDKNEFHKAHAIAAKIALDHEEFATETDSISIETTELWHSFRNAYSQFFSLESEDLRHWLSISKNPDAYVNKVVSAKSTFDSVSNKIQKLWLSVKSARSSLVQLRGLSRDLNKAVSKTDRVLNKYLVTLNEIRQDLNQLSDLAGELPLLIDDLRDNNGDR